MNRDERIELVAKAIGRVPNLNFLPTTWIKSAAYAAMDALEPLIDRDIRKARREGVREALLELKGGIEVGPNAIPCSHEEALAFDTYREVVEGIDRRLSTLAAKQEPPR